MQFWFKHLQRINYYSLEPRENGEKGIPRAVHNLGLHLGSKIRVVWRQKTKEESPHFG